VRVVALFSTVAKRGLETQQGTKSGTGNYNGLLNYVLEELQRGYTSCENLSALILAIEYDMPLCTRKTHLIFLRATLLCHGMHLSREFLGSTT
jgi:hypothetical protein